jgi:hypothetical protein
VGGYLYCTVRLSPTLRTSPALVPETVIVYAPLGVVTIGPLLVVPLFGMVREAPHPSRQPPISIAQTSRKPRRRRKPSSPSGNSPAHATAQPVPSKGLRSLAVATPVVTVTVIGVAAPSAALPGFTVQTPSGGAPTQFSAALPGTPATEFSSSRYVAL